MTRSFQILSVTWLLGCNLLSAQIIKNGSFECASVNPSTGWRGLAVGSTAICDWIVCSGNIDYIGTYWKASDSSRSVDLSGNTAGSICQSFKTVQDSTYEVLFDLAGNPDGGPSLKRLLVSAADSSKEFSFDTSGKNRQSMGWELAIFKFTAVDTLTTLTFANLVPGAYGPAIDNVRVDFLTSVKEIKIDTPQIFQLEQNYPNPFNPSTTILYELPQMSQVEAAIFNLLGERIRTLVNQRQTAGQHRLQWDGRNEFGMPMPSGVYLYRLRAGEFVQTRKMVLMQ